MDTFECTVKPQSYKCTTCSFQTDLKVELKLHLGQCNHPALSEKVVEIICQKCRFKTFSRLFTIHKCRKTRHKNVPLKFEFCDVSEQEIKQEKGDENETEVSNPVPPSIMILLPPIFNSNQRILLPKPKGAPQIDATKSLKPKTEWLHCDRCNFKTNMKRNLKEHIVVRHLDPEEINWVQCDRCEFQGKTKSLLRNHIARKHPSNDVKWFQCGLCEFKCKHRKNLTMHVADEHSEIRCKLCGHLSKTKAALKSHMISLHQSPDEISWYRCHLCEYKAKLKWGLRQHLVGKHAEGILRCDKCDYECKAKITLKKHMGRVHVQEK